MSLKVLIADPDWRFSRQISRHLESHAHLVVCESRPNQVVPRAVHWRPDLVILSVEVADEGILNALYALRSRPALLLTCWMDRYDLAWRVWQQGGDELLVKPVFRSEDLHQAIVSALENATAGTRTGSRPAGAASA
jgi:DNA-binding response OmpR family regulator